MRRVRIQTVIAVASFLMAVLLSLLGFFTPPEGELHDSNLYLIAQFLLVTTSIFGVTSIVSYKGFSGRMGRDNAGKE